MKVPSIEEAEQLLSEAETFNPGPWLVIQSSPRKQPIISHAATQRLILTLPTSWDIFTISGGVMAYHI